MEYFLVFNAVFALIVFIVCMYICLTPHIETGMYYTTGIAMIGMGAATEFATWLDGSSQGDGLALTAALASANLGLAICIIRFILSPKRHTLTRISEMVNVALHAGELEHGVDDKHLEWLEKSRKPMMHYDA
jgi:hypothetical protein